MSFRLLLVHYWTRTWSLEHFTFTSINTYNQCKVSISFDNVLHYNVVLFLMIFKYHPYFIQCNLYYKYDYYSPSTCTNYTPLMHWIIVFVRPSRSKYNFGPEDKTKIVPHDMQTLLKYTQKKEEEHPYPKEKTRKEGCTCI